ncbi:MAG: hypothetical protein IJP41_08985 [Synergistaceae bacterium]|nr:hypothetical protein [Synergistaceae bacterium]
MSNATLTKEEYELMLLNDDEEEELAPIFDKNGNPTPETLRSFYEAEHGLTHPITLEELKEWIDEL